MFKHVNHNFQSHCCTCLIKGIFYLFSLTILFIGYTFWTIYKAFNSTVLIGQQYFVLVSVTISSVLTGINIINTTHCTCFSGEGSTSSNNFLSFSLNPNECVGKVTTHPNCFRRSSNTSKKLSLSGTVEPQQKKQFFISKFINSLNKRVLSEFTYHFLEIW